MQKLLENEHGRCNIRLSIRLWSILTAHDFDMGNIDLITAYDRAYIIFGNAHSKYLIFKLNKNFYNGSLVTRKSKNLLAQNMYNKLFSFKDSFFANYYN